MTAAGVLADAGRLWRRDGDLLLRIAGPLVFLPALAFQLLVPRLAVPADATGEAVVAAYAAFFQNNTGGLLLYAAALELGRASLFAFYLHPAARDVGGALAAGVRLWPRAMLVALGVQLATLAGLPLLLVGALVFAGRLLPAGAVLFAQPRVSAVGALSRAVRITAGHTAVATALAGLVLAARLLLVWPFASLDGWLRSLGEPNPVALAIVDGAGAGAETLAVLAGVLVSVALYRALGGPEGAGAGAGASSGT